MSAANRCHASRLAIAIAFALAQPCVVWAQSSQPSTPQDTAAADETEPGAEERAKAEELEKIEVVGVRAAIFNSRALERQADNLKNVITADKVGQFTDQNVAESLQRLPALVIDRDAGEARRINIRGLGPLFNPVSLNGMRIGSSDLDRDSVVDVLPNDLLGTIEVIKTLTPDMDADAIGGAVDLRAIDPFERDPGGQVRLEASRQDYRGDTDPKVNAIYNGNSDLASGGRFGYSFAASFSDRSLQGNVIRNRGTPRYSRVGGECTNPTDPGCFLRSERIENRVDQTERERRGIAVNLDWQPSDAHEFYLRAVDSRYDQEISQWNDRWQIANNSAVTIGPNVGTFRNAELRKQVTFSTREERTWMAQLGGASRAGDWLFEYFLGASENDLDIPENLLGRFRIRGIFADVVQTPNVSYVSGRRGTAATSDPSNPANYAFDQLTLNQERRLDEIRTLKLDATREFEFSDRPTSFKFGIKLNRRDKETDRTETVGNPAGTGGVGNVTLADLDLIDLDTDIPFYGFQPARGPTLDLFRRARAVLAPSLANSAANDLGVAEDVDAAYLMGTIDINTSLRLFGGVRVERTNWEASGTEFEEIDPLTGNDILSVRALPSVENDYTDVLPSLHLRWEPREDLVWRAAFTTALIRPNFDEASATRSTSTEEIAGAPGTYFRSTSSGNPLLDPLKAYQFDLSLAWYPDEATYLFGGVFYKRIEDFFVDALFEGAAVARIGLPVGNGTINGGFDTAEAFLNGDRATVRGAEFAFEKAFIELPGFWSGLFVSGNFTIQDSDSEIPLLRPGESLPLIDQADRVANLSVGWENERFSVRVAANYRDEQVDAYSSSPFLDEILGEWFAYDVSLRWNIDDRWQLYVDAVNLDARKDPTRLRGDANGTFASDEGVNDFGPSYALGVRYSF
jgi:TonB-dependent receptor